MLGEAQDQMLGENESLIEELLAYKHSEDDNGSAAELHAEVLAVQKALKKAVKERDGLREQLPPLQHRAAIAEKAYENTVLALRDLDSARTPPRSPQPRTTIVARLYWDVFRVGFVKFHCKMC